MDPGGIFNKDIRKPRMPQLLCKPFGTRGKVHRITPESAGWRYVGFSLYHLKSGDHVSEDTGAREVILVMGGRQSKDHRWQTGLGHSRPSDVSL